ncbi:SIMPL domain-containing protein [Robiginitalea sp.]|nr:SIMPL domain-containing protein [Robiginitalea sp.]
MKNLSWLPAMLIALGLSVAGYFIGETFIKGKQFDRFVSVKGLSEREVPADLAVWPVNIILTGNDLPALQRQVEYQNKVLYQFFMEQGFTSSEVTRGIVNITDAQANIYNSAAQYNPNRFLAKSEFTVRTSDIEKLHRALSASLNLLSDGIIFGSKNEWQPVEYIFKGLNTLKPEMIEEATRNAREVADKFARDSDSRVGDIRVARQGQFSISDRDINTPQIKVVRVVSTIDFQLVD